MKKLFFVFVCALFLIGCSDRNEGGKGIQPINVPPVKESVSELFRSGLAYHCFVDDAVNNLKIDLWMGGGKWRQTILGPEIYNYNIIKQGEMLYTWVQGEKLGVKYNLNEIGEGMPVVYYEIEMFEMFPEVSCSPEVDVSMFNIPAVKFVYLGDLFMEMRNDECAMCAMFYEKDQKQGCLDDCN